MGLEVRELNSCNPSAETLWNPGKRQDREGKGEGGTARAFLLAPGFPITSQKRRNAQLQGPIEKP